jgi:hypothetical protein
MRAFSIGRLVLLGSAVAIALAAAAMLAGCCESSGAPYLVPRSKTVAPGETVTFAVKRTFEVTRGKVTVDEEGDAYGDYAWAATGPMDSPVTGTGSNTAEWTAPDTPGTYRISATGAMQRMNADDRGYIATVEAVITVIEAEPAQPVFDNGNALGVKEGGKSPRVKITQDIVVTQISTYHYNKGKGAAPGNLSLQSESGTTYGPWQAAGAVGQGNVPNAFWVAKPDAAVPAGTYTIIDSDPGTWSQNSKSNGFGFATIQGSPAPAK